MEIDDEEMDQLPSSSSGTKGDRKRFEVKKVKLRKILCISNDFHFSIIHYLMTFLNAFVSINGFYFITMPIFSGMQLLCGLGVS